MIHIPQWLKDRENNATEDPEYLKRTRYLKNRYLIRSLAMICDETGHLRILGEKLGLEYNQIVKLAGNFDSVIPGEIAVRMEKLAGRDFMPRKLLRPDLFE